MDADIFITSAIALGETSGLAALGSLQQIVFAVSEAEVTCDVDGIDNLIYRYGADSLPLFGRAYAEIGAAEIAEALRQLATSPMSESLLGRTNSLISNRTGYDYEAIRTYVAARI
jgi:hypothetical protein